MPITAFLHTHVLVVVLFLLLFCVKAFLLFTNKHQTLEKMKKSTKVLDMIFGTLILVTGGYLLTQYHGIPTWLLVKIVLVLVAIPLGIVGLKKQNKILTLISLVIFLYVYGVAETKSLNMKKEKPAEPAATEAVTATETAPAISEKMNETALANARAIYNQQCATCHGEDGKKALNGASDLSISAISIEERKAIILNGKGLMPAFQGQISEQEAEELAAYTQTLKK